MENKRNHTDGACLTPTHESGNQEKEKPKEQLIWEFDTVAGHILSEARGLSPEGVVGIFEAVTRKLERRDFAGWNSASVFNRIDQLVEAVRKKEELER